MTTRVRPDLDTATLSPEQQAVSIDPRVSAAPRHVADKDVGKLSPEQAAIARHVWTSPDRVILIRGGAGTGKTHAMKATIAGIDRPVVVLAPSADASRGVLREEGFAGADTVARFLVDEKFQQQAKDGVIWVDEAGLLGMRQVRRVFDAADRLDARVVLQGDRRQHGSVERGATLRVLERHAGLPVARLTDIRRQKGEYKKAVKSLSEGEMLAGYDALDGMGWVRTVESNAPLVADYMAALDARKEVLAIAPTHAEAEEVTHGIRLGLKARGLVAGEEHVLDTLRPLHWTDAEKGDAERYDGTEVIQFHRNGGTFKAGERIAISDFKPGMRLGPPSTFAVYGRQALAVATGDRIRITANGKTADLKHHLSNGARYTVAGVEKDGNIRLANGWFLSPGYAHLTHGYVTTSHASQGKTVDVVLIAMGSESLPATSAEQFYVSVSRGREKATIYTDVPADKLREAIQRADARKSATELMKPDEASRRRGRTHSLLARARQAWRVLRQRNGADMPRKAKQREGGYAR